MPATRTPGRGSDLAPPVKPGPDVYVGLLVLSLLAQVAAALFLWMDYSSYPEGGKPPKVQPPAIVGASSGAPAAAPANVPPAPQPAVAPAPAPK
jgi:hypothetical protein